MCACCSIPTKCQLTIFDILPLQLKRRLGRCVAWHASISFTIHSFNHWVSHLFHFIPNFLKVTFLCHWSCPTIITSTTSTTTTTKCITTLEGRDISNLKSTRARARASYVLQFEFWVGCSSIQVPSFCCCCCCAVVMSQKSTTLYWVTYNSHHLGSKAVWTEMRPIVFLASNRI